MNWISRLLTEREQGLEHLGKGLGKTSNSTRSSFSTACLTIVALLAICSVSICSLAQEQRLSQYAHRAWLMRDGFFSGSPNAITQTTDGYIWIGTASGLFRFDGSRFEPWSSPDGEQLPSNEIYGLLGARDGSLWIGMRGGLAKFVDRKLVVYPDFHDDVAGLLEDQSGNIWFTRSEAGGALRTPVCQALPTRIHLHAPGKIGSLADTVDRVHADLVTKMIDDCLTAAIEFMIPADLTDRIWDHVPDFKWSCMCG